MNQVLYIDPKPYAEYLNPSSSGSQDKMLTRFSIAIMVGSKKGHSSVNISWNSLRLIRLFKH